MRLKKSRQYKKLKKSVKEGEILIIPSDDRLIEEGNPPYVAGPRSLPSWFRMSPKSGVRRCAGIQNFLELGVVVPAWTTFNIDPDDMSDNWKISSSSMLESSRPFGVDAFPFDSTGSCPMTSIRKKENSLYPKLVTPYSFVTAPGWSVMIVGFIHEPNENYDIVSGIVHTDFYHQVNVVLNLKSNKKFQILHNEPLFQLIPFKRSGDFKKIKFVSEEYYKYSRFIDGDLDQLGSVGFEGMGLEYKRLTRKSDEF